MKTIVIDDNPQSYSLNIENSININKWFIGM